MDFNHKLLRKLELTEQLIEMKTRKEFLEQKIEEFQNRLNVLNGFIVYVELEIKKAEAF